MVTGEAAGLVEEDREEAKSLVMIYMPKMYNNQPKCDLVAGSKLVSFAFGCLPFFVPAIICLCGVAGR